MAVPGLDIGNLGSNTRLKWKVQDPARSVALGTASGRKICKIWQSFVTRHGENRALRGTTSARPCSVQHFPAHTLSVHPILLLPLLTFPSADRHSLSPPTPILHQDFGGKESLSAQPPCVHYLYTYLVPWLFPQHTTFFPWSQAMQTQFFEFN